MSEEKAKIVVVGVGNCGGNIITALDPYKIPAKRIAVNTDEASLRKTLCDVRIHVGSSRSVDERRGASGMPDLGEKLMEDDVGKITREIDEDTDVVIGIAGLGRGTGGGGLPVLLSRLHEERPDTVTLALVTLPFRTEGKQRRRNAQYSLDKVSQTADSYMIFSNELLIRKYRKLSIPEAFRRMNLYIARIVDQLVRLDERGTISIDFSDMRRNFKDGDLCFIGIGRETRRSILESFDTVFHNDYSESDITGGKAAITICEGQESLLKEDEITLIHERLVEKYKISDIYMSIRPKLMVPTATVTLLVSGVKSHYLDKFMREVD